MPATWQPYSLISDCPPLIQAVINSKLLHPLLKVKKLDPGNSISTLMFIVCSYCVVQCTVQYSNEVMTEAVANTGVRGDECATECEGK